MAIKLSDIRYHYAVRPQHTVLNIPSWSLNNGDQVFVHGPSGGGKSTLLGLLSGLLVPNKGQITVLGQRLDNMSNRQRDRFRAQNIGYVFQQFNLMPYLNAIDNVLLATQFSAQKHRVELKDEIKNLFNELNISDKDWSRPTRELSIGQQQRVAIARAISNKPKILLTDEPTGNLDPETSLKVFEQLLALSIDEKVTVLVATHNMNFINYMNRVLTVHKGKAVPF